MVVASDSSCNDAHVSSVLNPLSSRFSGWLRQLRKEFPLSVSLRTPQFTW